jgi:hypothetical protein
MFQIMRHPEPKTFDYINKHPMPIRTWFEQVRVFNSCIVTPASTSILSTMMLIHLQTKLPIRRFHCETSGATIWVHMNSHRFTFGAQMLQSLFFITHRLWQWKTFMAIQVSRHIPDSIFQFQTSPNRRSTSLLKNVMNKCWSAFSVENTRCLYKTNDLHWLLTVLREDDKSVSYFGQSHQHHKKLC